MSLRVWLPLNGDLHNQGLSTVSLSGSPTWGTGKIGSKSFCCNTGITGITISDLVNVTTFSVAYWLYVDSSITDFTNYADFWELQAVSGDTTTVIRDELRTNTANLGRHALHMIKDASVGSNTNTYYGLGERDDAKDKWCHVVVTKDANYCNAYADGIRYAHVACSNFENSSAKLNGKFWLGMSGCKSAYLNDFRIYDHCLSEQEVKKLAQGLVVHYPLNRQGLGQENLVCGTHDWNRWIASSRASFNGDVATLTGSTADWAAAIHSAHLDKHLLDGSTTYTWSFEYKSTATWNCNPVIGGTATELGATSNSRTKYCYWQSALNLSSTGGVWKKYVLNSRTISESQMTSGSGDVNSWFLQIYNRTDDVAVNIRRIKLEKGTIATSYSKNRYDSIFEILTYDKALYIEPDGTQWIRIAHHNNPGNAQFASSDNFVGGVYKDANRWYQVEKACNFISSNEFIVKQKNASDSTEVKYRWKQTKSLLTATYSDVAPTAVTRIITAGYTDGSYGGLYIKGGNARLCIADGADGDWWGAIGCWTTYQSGLPGYPKQVVTTGYIDLYIRVDNINIDNSIEYDISGFGNNGTRIGGFTWSSNTPKYEVSTQFNGANYIKTLPGQLAWSNYDNLTIAAWIKPTTTPSSWTGSIGIAHDGSYSYKLFGISNYGGKFTVHTVTGTAWTSTQSTYVCPLNEWHHYVATLEGTTCKMYIDGILNKTFTVDWGTATNHSSPQFQIGVDLPGTDEIYTGYYSDTRIYATALSADEVFELYHNF